MVKNTVTRKWWNTNCPVGFSINGVLENRLISLKETILKDMEGMTLLDMYKDMKKLLKEKE